MSLIQELQTLIRINTEYDEKSIAEGKPYGDKISKGLDYLKEKALEDGFSVKEYDGYALAIIYGQQKNRIEAVSHIDVVPASEGWTHGPYDGNLIGNRLYGRGTQDMKTALWLTYSALKEIKAEGHQLKRQIRVVVGTDEERTMHDIEHYLKVDGLPDFAFTPDSAFPICLGEKGAISWDIKRKIETRIQDLKAGTVPNVICDRVALTLTESDAIQFEKEAVNQGVSITRKNTTIIVHGKSAHTSTPEKGDNAIISFLKVFTHCFDEAWAQELYRSFDQYNGTSLGYDSIYEPMGALSVCLNTMDIVAGNLAAGLDIRFPTPLKSESIIQTIADHLPNFNFEVTYQEEPIESQLEDPFVKTCIDTYYEMFPEDKTPPFYSGGVTYAKKYQGRCVAYGLRVPSDTFPNLAHQVDEYIETDKLEMLVSLYKKALLDLANV